MPSQFVLRDENTAENPFIARLYGLGITQGKNVLYQTVTNRTVFLSVIMEGSRFRGDLATSKAIKVWYAGFELPEFPMEHRISSPCNVAANDSGSN